MLKPQLDFDTLTGASNWINVIGLIASALLLLSFLVLPAEKTSRHYLTVCFILGVCILQLGFIIPLAAKPDQCHDAITPNDMRSDLTCAFSGASLLVGGFAAITWVFIRSLFLHLQICWQVQPGRKFFWSSVLAGWAIPITFATIVLILTGVSYRFGDTCHINHDKAVQDYWIPLLCFAGASTILQFSTFGYCIRVYLTALLNDDVHSSSHNGSGLPSYSSSVKTVTTRQAYQRVKKVISLQWRGIVIVLIIIANVTFLAVVFVSMDSTTEAAKEDFTKLQPWLLCLVMNEGNKNACLDLVKEHVASEATVMAVLIVLALNGIWVLIFLGRFTMVRAWIDLFKLKFGRKHPDFVSVDARRHSLRLSGNYKMIKSPASTYRGVDDTPSIPERTFSPTTVTASEKALMAISPSSTYSTDTNNNKRTEYFGKEARYASPTLSFSSPRPPSAASGGVSRAMSMSSIGREWDPRDTHAKSNTAGGGGGGMGIARTIHE